MTGVDTTLLLPGMYAAVYFIDGAGIAVTNEAMEEVNDIENGNPKYTVYQITDEDKQFLDPTVTPTFEKQLHGAGDFSAISSGDIREIQYPGGRVVLEAAINNDDVIRMATGSYKAKTQIWGALTTKIKDGSVVKECTPLGATAKRNVPIIEDMNVSLDIFLNKVCAQLVANDLILTHQKGGTAGNTKKFAMLNPAGLNTLSIAIVGNEITVTLGHDGANIISTNQNVVDIVNASPEVIRLGVVCECDLDDASSLASAFVQDSLAGGLDPVNYSTKKSSLFGMEIFANESDNIKWQGYFYISSIDSDVSNEDIVKQSLTMDSFGQLYYRPR